MLGDDDFAQDNSSLGPAVAAAATDAGGKKELASAEVGKPLVEHGRVTEYVVPKIEGKFPSAAKLGELAADSINDLWGESGGLIKYASPQTQFAERGKDPTARGLARYIRSSFNGMWESWCVGGGRLRPGDQRCSGGSDGGRGCGGGAAAGAAGVRRPHDG